MTFDAEQNDRIIKKMYLMRELLDLTELNDWYCKFIVDVFNKYQAGCDLSDKQLAIIEKAYDKCEKKINPDAQSYTVAFRQLRFREFKQTIYNGLETPMFRFYIAKEYEY